MRHEEARRRLGDYVDGELPASEARDVTAHLETCDACRAEVADLRRLLQAARGWDVGQAPRRDLWPGIAQRLRAAAEPPGAERAAGACGWRRWRGLWPSLAATAAVVTIMVFSALQEEPPARREGPAEPHDGAAPSGATAAIVSALEAECRQSDRAYAALARRHADGGSASVLAIFEKNLQAIDQAISEARTAWESNPDSPQLIRLLAAAYQARAALQGRAMEVVSQS
jgi:anti-sigma factor RsiW